MDLGILCSGSLGYKTLRELYVKYQINFVFTDLNSLAIIEFCKENGIPIFLGNPRKGKAKDFIANNKCEILISINYLFLIERDIIELSNGIAFNIHGSLLPKYRGRTPHVWAIINGEEFTGITAHIIDEGCDTGDILEQIEIPISQDDTGNDVLMKYAVHYLELIEKIILDYNHHKLNPRKQKSQDATYFGKRVPTDGEINWDWHKHRIYNWIRAQAYPYPGAFTFYNGNKLTIDKVAFSDFGFDYTTPNGTILNVKPLLVKTPNGAIEIKVLREKIEFNIGELLQ